MMRVSPTNRCQMPCPPAPPIPHQANKTLSYAPRLFLSEGCSITPGRRRLPPCRTGRLLVYITHTTPPLHLKSQTEARVRHPGNSEDRSEKLVLCSHWLTDGRPPWLKVIGCSFHGSLNLADSAARPWAAAVRVRMLRGPSRDTGTNDGGGHGCTAGSIRSCGLLGDHLVGVRTEHVDRSVLNEWGGWHRSG